MKKRVSDFQVIENRKINDNYYVLSMMAPESLSALMPGQFVQVRIDDAPNTFLRRPISIYEVDYAANIISLLILIAGEGTKKLSSLKKGDSVNLIYPLGNSFSLPGKGNVLLVGGGVGVAPLLFLGTELKKQGISLSFLIGARSRKHLVDLDKFSATGPVYITTEDGSYGEKGLVTQHSMLNERLSDFNMIYTCGPDPMMKAVASLAKVFGIDCEVSLENLMACGFGACLCCIQATTRGNICVCVEGPVLNTREIIW